ncbi:hypothetical protein CYMTET_49368 [Cymbomonas tetramitiformis]|uniref:GYF domain-containing protein n=1 Tax=Cymbomonas tetramitiformis TaxID=36881 RepID=A0AAE0BQD2_9CHLO|nr:hypothetical protein CYMTET_49368 [Cymbomonas tetramitiformis]
MASYKVSLLSQKTGKLQPLNLLVHADGVKLMTRDGTKQLQHLLYEHIGKTLSAKENAIELEIKKKNSHGFLTVTCPNAETSKMILDDIAAAKAKHAAGASITASRKSFSKRDSTKLNPPPATPPAPPPPEPPKTRTPTRSHRPFTPQKGIQSIPESHGTPPLPPPAAPPPHNAVQVVPSYALPPPPLEPPPLSSKRYIRPVALPFSVTTEVIHQASGRRMAVVATVDATGLALKDADTLRVLEVFEFSQQLKSFWVEKGLDGIVCLEIAVLRNPGATQALYLRVPQPEVLVGALEYGQAEWAGSGYTLPEVATLKNELLVTEQRFRDAEVYIIEAEKRATGADVKAAAANDEVARLRTELELVHQQQEDMSMKVGLLVQAFKDGLPSGLGGRGSDRGLPMSPVMTDLNWCLVTARGEQEGPYSLAQLRALVVSGALTPEVQIEDLRRGFQASLFSVLAHSVSDLNSRLPGSPSTSPHKSPKGRPPPPRPAPTNNSHPTTPPPYSPGGDRTKTAKGEERWLILDDNRQFQGPYSLQQLEVWLSAGYISRNAVVVNSKNSTMQTTLGKVLIWDQQ